MQPHANSVLKMSDSDFGYLHPILKAEACLQKGKMLMVWQKIQTVLHSAHRLVAGRSICVYIFVYVQINVNVNVYCVFSLSVYFWQKALPVTCGCPGDSLTGSLTSIVQ